MLVLFVVCLNAGSQNLSDEEIAEVRAVMSNAEMDRERIAVQSNHIYQIENMLDECEEEKENVKVQRNFLLGSVAIETLIIIIIFIL